MAIKINIPTILTIIRLVLSPLMLPLLLVYFLPYNNIWINSALAFLFLLFSITDFFDGYLARKYKQETGIGKILDPIADKALMYSTLISLLAIHKIYFYWVIILVGRDFFIMGLRLVASEHAFSIPVTWVAKIKTAVQMILLTFLVITPYQSLGFKAQGLWWNSIEIGLLVLTIFLSLVTAQRYYQSFIKQFNEQQQHIFFERV